MDLKTLHQLEKGQTYEFLKQIYAPPPPDTRTWYQKLYKSAPRGTTINKTCRGVFDGSRFSGNQYSGGYHVHFISEDPDCKTIALAEDIQEDKQKLFKHIPSGGSSRTRKNKKKRKSTRRA